MFLLEVEKTYEGESFTMIGVRRERERERERIKKTKKMNKGKIL